MLQERRKYKRLDLVVTIQLESISLENITTEKYLKVDVQNISHAGLGFKSSYKLEEGSCYDTKIRIWTKEEINTVIKIVRCDIGEDLNTYGCIFVGLPEKDAIKIDIYQIVKESETNRE